MRLICLLLALPLMAAPLPDLFDREDQDIVLSTKKFVFERFPDAFNPSLSKIDGGFLLTFRYCPDRENQSWLSFIGIAVLDEALNVISEPELLTTRPKYSKTPTQAEDARLFSYRGRLFLIYNDNVDEIYFDHSKRRDLFVAELLYTKDRFSLSSPIKLYCEEKASLAHQQKNWTPFEWNQTLLFTYSIHPHELLSSTLKSGACHSAHKTQASLQWPYGTLRGSTPPLLVDGEYLAFFHSGMKMKSPFSNGVKLWHYFAGAYTFAATPPFALTKISPTPILGEDFYTCSGHEKRVIFPGGCAITGPRLYLAYGKDDCEVWIAVLDLEALKKSLVPVQ